MNIQKSKYLTVHTPWWAKIKKRNSGCDAGVFSPKKSDTSSIHLFRKKTNLGKRLDFVHLFLAEWLKCPGNADILFKMGNI